MCSRVHREEKFAEVSMIEQYSLFCSECNNSFKTLKGLRQHYSKAHKSVRHTSHKKIVYEGNLTDYG